jgi:carboxy-terminal domain RNA polymerase II polypeptide A small phosphatase
LNNVEQIKGILPPQSPRSRGKKSLILDLDETLVHSSFKPPPQDECIILPVEIDGKKFKVYVLVRPGAMEFLKEMQKYYECIIYTASLSKYADPLMDILDDKQSCSGRLFREHCTFYQGMYVKDLSELGRDLKDVLIIDNSPTAYLFQPDNALPIISWYDEKEDT